MFSSLFLFPSSRGADQQSAGAASRPADARLQPAVSTQHAVVLPAVAPPAAAAGSSCWLAARPRPAHASTTPAARRSQPRRSHPRRPPPSAPRPAHASPTPPAGCSSIRRRPPQLRCMRRWMRRRSSAQMDAPPPKTKMGNFFPPTCAQ